MPQGREGLSRFLSRCCCHCRRRQRCCHCHCAAGATAAAAAAPGSAGALLCLSLVEYAHQDAWRAQVLDIRHGADFDGSAPWGKPLKTLRGVHTRALPHSESGGRRHLSAHCILTEGMPPMSRFRLFCPQ